MSLVDRSWSEPHGIAVAAPVEAVEPAAPVEPVPLAAGTAAHAAIADGGHPAPVDAPAGDAPAGDAPRLFFNLPVGPLHAGQTWPMSRPDLAGGRPQHDATSIVAPLPRPRAHDQSAPRAVGIASEHAARVRQQKAAARRSWRIVLLACPIAGIVLGFAVLALLSREPAPRAAVPARPGPRVVLQATAPAPPAKAVRPKAVAAKKPAAQAIEAAAPRPIAAAAPKAAAPKAPRKPAKKVALKDSPAAKKPTAKTAKTASTAKAAKTARTAKAAKAAKAAPPATSKLAKAAAKAKQPAPAKPARR